MTVLSIDEFKTLVEQPQFPCISLYMPTQKAGAEIRQNPIRFKNLIKAAEERLEELGMRSTEALDLLQPARELDKNDFWEHQEEGLVIFISPNQFHYYCVPITLPELVIVGEQFHLKPLLHLINNDGSFYILALSQQEVKFFQATRYSINEIEVENMPETLEAALLEEALQKGVQHRIATGKGGTANPAQHPGSFHGQGSPDQDKHQEDILQFCYAVDRALHEKIKEEKAPLILAGVEYLFPLYREANTYSHLLAAGITGNQEDVKPEQLREQAWEIVEPLFHQHEEEAIALYQQLAGEGTNQATNELKEIVPAAYYHRVDTLFVPVGKQVWGKLDPENMSLDLHPEPEPNDEDLLDLAAVHTLLNGGKVYTLEPEKMPNGSTLAAIFRY
ncbi:MAG TPA: hypothetical protein VK203_21920 [Nostocaceae cyanobacterium]|nr:hypothetical protein [Nostocaceae cyanobacterium]